MSPLSIKCKNRFDRQKALALFIFVTLIICVALVIAGRYNNDENADSSVLDLTYGAATASDDSSEDSTAGTPGYRNVSEGYTVSTASGSNDDPEDSNATTPSFYSFYGSPTITQSYNTFDPSPIHTFYGSPTTTQPSSTFDSSPNHFTGPTISYPTESKTHVPSPLPSIPSFSPTHSQPLSEIPSTSPTAGTSPEVLLDHIPSSFPSKMIPTMQPQSLSTQTPATGPPTLGPSTPVTTQQPLSTPSTIFPELQSTSLLTTKPNIPVNRTITFGPGNLTQNENGLKLSEGLTSRIIARSGRKVTYKDGQESKIQFHDRPDAGATFVDNRNENPGGWVYVSNSEIRHQDEGEGGVGALTFDKNGDLIHYDMVLTGTSWNCGGGRTPWETWISCEEDPNGIIYQVDPFGVKEGSPITLGQDFGGRFESFAYDVRNRYVPRFFVTEDHEKGAIQRFTPFFSNWSDPWSILHGDGAVHYLLLEPNQHIQVNGGSYRWITDRTAARENAAKYYPNCEGIDVDDNFLYFVCKKIKIIFELNLDDGTYTNASTTSGLFDGGPDQLQRILGARDDYDLLYFTEEGGKDAGIHARNFEGEFITILESPVYNDETTGLAFSPDGKHLYVAYQVNGILFDVTRMDGLPFHAKALNVKYHAQGND